MRTYWLSTMFILVACVALAQDQGKKGGPAGPPLMMIQVASVRASVTSRL
jgi:hypothetical protein